MANKEKRGKFFPAVNVLAENKTFNARQTFSVHDALSRFLLLVDSGSGISALPIGWIKPSRVTRKIIKALTIQTNISIIGCVNLT